MEKSYLNFKKDILNVFDFVDKLESENNELRKSIENISNDSNENKKTFRTTESIISCLYRVISLYCNDRQKLCKKCDGKGYITEKIDSNVNSISCSCFDDSVSYEIKEFHVVSVSNNYYTVMENEEVVKVPFSSILPEGKDVTGIKDITNYYFSTKEDCEKSMENFNNEQTY